MATGNHIIPIRALVVFSSRFKVVFDATWKASCGKLWDCFKRYTNHQLVAKHEQILCMTSCEYDERAARPKFVAQSRPALYHSQWQVDRTRWKTQNISQVESFCTNVSNILLLSLKSRYKRYRLVFVSHISLHLEHRYMLLTLPDQTAAS